jgi:hypothetical protein
MLHVYATPVPMARALGLRVFHNNNNVVIAPARHLRDPCVPKQIAEAGEPRMQIIQRAIVTNRSTEDQGGVTAIWIAALREQLLDSLPTFNAIARQRLSLDPVRCLAFLWTALEFTPHNAPVVSTELLLFRTLRSNATVRVQHTPGQTVTLQSVKTEELPSRHQTSSIVRVPSHTVDSFVLETGV